jgi:hypothetical protein
MLMVPSPLQKAYTDAWFQSPSLLFVYSTATLNVVWLLLRHQHSMQDCNVQGPSDDLQDFR